MEPPADVLTVMRSANELKARLERSASTVEQAQSKLDALLREAGVSSVEELTSKAEAARKEMYEHAYSLAHTIREIRDELSNHEVEESPA